MRKYTAHCVYLQAEIHFSHGEIHSNTHVEIHCTLCKSAKRKYTFPHGEIHIKLWIPDSKKKEKEKKSFPYKFCWVLRVLKKTQIKQNFHFAFLFPCFMSRFSYVYYKTAVPVGYVPQW